jgi:vancomycin resistance protein YoaR
MSAATNLASRSLVDPIRARQVGVLLLPGLLLVCLIAMLVYHLAYVNRIFPGLSVARVPLGGKDLSEAQAALSPTLAVADQQSVVVEAVDQQWAFSRASLGASYDGRTLAEAAMQVGRTGSLFDQLAVPISLLASPQDLTATLQLTAADWDGRLAPISAAVDRPAVDARLEVSSNGQVTIIPDQAGRRLDRAAARQQIASAVVSGSITPVTLAVEPIPPRVGASDLAGPAADLTQILSAPLEVSFGGQIWLATTASIHQAVRINPGARGADLVDQSFVSSFVDEIASGLDRPGVDARLDLAGDKVVVRSSQTALKLDRGATAKLLNAALLSSQRAIQPAVVETPPNVVDADLAVSLALANRLIGASVDAQGPSGEKWSLGPPALRQMLILPVVTVGSQVARPRLDDAKLAAFVAAIAKSVDSAPLNARFQRDASGQIRLNHAGVPGSQVDQAQSLALLSAAATDTNRVVTLPINAVAPTFASDNAGSLAGLQLIAENTTSYVGSIPPRRHNVELATSLLNGVVVPPGEIFSFNHELGPTTLDRGFQVGYGIEAQGTTVKTVPSVAGGICQVATTLFQPVFWNGYTIEERYSHLYWIAHYAYHGVIGLDTTVDEDAGLDSRFKNDTARPLLIQSWTDGSQVHFAVYGDPPTWKVQVDPSVITNVVKTDPKPEIQQDPTMPKGQSVITEAAEDGFQAVVRRLVTNADGTTRELKLRSTYIPAHNVTVVGTKP